MTTVASRNAICSGCGEDDVETSELPDSKQDDQPLCPKCRDRQMGQALCARCEASLCDFVDWLGQALGVREE